jgi:hypothetical protein
MKKISLTFLAFIFLAIAVQTGFAQNEKELVIKTARALETNPLANDTIKMREKALRWVIETDEVHLIVCGGVFSMFSDKKNKNGSDMIASYTIGMAAFKLENPAKANDENAAQLAGLETALKTYEAIVKEKPKTKNDGIEALLVKMNNGELAAAVNAADCGKK